MGAGRTGFVVAVVPDDTVIGAAGSFVVEAKMSLDFFPVRCIPSILPELFIYGITSFLLYGNVGALQLPDDGTRQRQLPMHRSRKWVFQNSGPRPSGR